MNLHEYQAKALFRQYGINTARGVVIFSLKEFDAKLKELNATKFVVKAQIHAGGRGKAGGVKLAHTVQEAKEHFQKMLDSVLVTKQTTSLGQLVRRVYVEEAQNIKKEYYLSIVLDRAVGRVVVVFSSEGGVDIEEVAHDFPEKIAKVVIDPLIGMHDFYIRRLISASGFDSVQAKKFADLVKSLYKLFIETDASQIEINPLIENADGLFVALDAKINFDDNALFRHPMISELRDTDEEDPSEFLASKYGLNYVKMDGKIGCVVNGAGLAMATMDIIKYYGSSPANFLDVGGSATLETVTQAFKIILADSRVEGILVSIFGGIMRCNIIAEGIVNAVKTMSLSVPVVVRLIGTNHELGKKILAESGLNIIPAESLEDAAQTIVALVRKNSV